MGFQIHKVQVWSGELPNRPGAAAAKLVIRLVPTIKAAVLRILFMTQFLLLVGLTSPMCRPRGWLPSSPTLGLALLERLSRACCSFDPAC